jgi:hypothetical protein
MALPTPAHGPSEPFSRLLARLSHQSVVRHFDAYADIPWERPEYRIDPEDSRWELPDYGMLGATAWYRAQPAGTRARLGLHLLASFMKAGAQFENILQRGLLEYALALPNGAPEFRYVYHEVIEEGQHSLMFQEFVNRTGLDVPGQPAVVRFGSRPIAALGRAFPELFFVYVLGGEDPIDHVQRRFLESGRPMHPLAERISRIHVTEEARHLAFARQSLRERVPRLGPARRRALELAAPLVLATIAEVMMRPPRHLIATYEIPPEVIDEAYTRNPRHRTAVLEALGKTRELCRELGIVTPRLLPLWRRLGLWERMASRPAGG